MKKQYIILILAIIGLIVSLIFLPIIGEILFIPFVYIFQYTCRSSNRQTVDPHDIQEIPQNHSNTPIETQNIKVKTKQEKLCKICGAGIIEPNLRYCESCGAKLS